MKSKISGELYSLSAVLTDLLNFKDIFVHHEIIPPGRRASSAHCHSTQEEMVVVLCGNPLAHVDNEKIQMAPGDFIGFEPGKNQMHFIENASSSEVHVLTIASSQINDKVSYERDASGSPTVTS